MKHSHPSWWLLAGFAACLTAQASPQSAAACRDIAAERSHRRRQQGRHRPEDRQVASTDPGRTQQLSEQSRGAAKARRAEPLGAGKKGFVGARHPRPTPLPGQRRLPAGGLVQPVPESSMTDLMIVRGADGQLRMGHADDATKLRQAKEASNE